MKRIKNLFIIILTTINIILLIVLLQRSASDKKTISIYQKSFYNNQTKNEEYVENLLKYNLLTNSILDNEIRVISDSSLQLLLTEVIGKYKIVIYFPKMVCKDCLRAMFKLVTENQKFKTSDFLIISDFYSLGELKYYKKEFGLQDYNLFLLEKPESMKIFKYPIIFSTEKNRVVFLFDKAYLRLFYKFLNNDF